MGIERDVFGKLWISYSCMEQLCLDMPRDFSEVRERGSWDMANLCPGRRVPALLWWDVVWCSVGCSLRAAEHLLLSVWQEMSSHPHAVTVSGGQGLTKDKYSCLQSW